MCKHSSRRTCLLIALALAAIGLVTLGRSTRDRHVGAFDREVQAKSVFAQFDKPLVPDHVLFLAVAGRESRIVACLGRKPGELPDRQHADHRLVFFEERLLSRANGGGFLDGAPIPRRPEILAGFDLTAGRDLAMVAIDLDSDGFDEVLASGGGGAGGTGMLEVFKLNGNRVQRIYNDSSRFPIYVFRRQRDEPYSVANAGFEFVLDDNHMMRPIRFDIYAIEPSGYRKTRGVEGGNFEVMISELDKRWGPPNGPPHVEVFDRP